MTGISLRNSHLTLTGNCYATFLGRSQISPPTVLEQSKMKMMPRLHKKVDSCWPPTAMLGKAWREYVVVSRNVGPPWH